MTKQEKSFDFHEGTSKIRLTIRTNKENTVVHLLTIIQVQIEKKEEDAYISDALPKFNCGCVMATSTSGKHLAYGQALPR